MKFVAFENGGMAGQWAWPVPPGPGLRTVAAPARGAVEAAGAVGATGAGGRSAAAPRHSHACVPGGCT